MTCQIRRAGNVSTTNNGHQYPRCHMLCSPPKSQNVRTLGAGIRSRQTNLMHPASDVSPGPFFSLSLSKAILPKGNTSWEDETRRATETLAMKQREGSSFPSVSQSTHTSLLSLDVVRDNGLAVLHCAQSYSPLQRHLESMCVWMGRRCIRLAALLCCCLSSFSNPPLTKEASMNRRSCNFRLHYSGCIIARRCGRLLLVGLFGWFSFLTGKKSPPRQGILLYLSFGPYHNQQTIAENSVHCFFLWPCKLQYLLRPDQQFAPLGGGSWQTPCPKTTTH